MLRDHIAIALYSRLGEMTLQHSCNVNMVVSIYSEDGDKNMHNEA